MELDGRKQQGSREFVTSHVMIFIDLHMFRNAGRFATTTQLDLRPTEEKGLPGRNVIEPNKDHSSKVTALFLLKATAGGPRTPRPSRALQPTEYSPEAKPASHTDTVLRFFRLARSPRLL